MDIYQKMRLTLDLAETAMEYGECPIAAMIFLDDIVVAENYTREYSERRLLVHAELGALTDADRMRYSIEQRQRMRLFTNLEPCMMCIGAAMSFCIGEIYYALESPTDGAAGIARGWDPHSDDFSIYRTPVIAGGILREESRALFAVFAQKCPPGGMRDFALSLARL